MATDTTSKPKGIIVISKDDWGVPNPDLMRELKPLNRDRCMRQEWGDLFGLVKGKEYEFIGDVERFKSVYPKTHPKAGQPAGLQLLFDIKGHAKKELDK